MKKQLDITLGNYQNFVGIENPQGEYALMMLYGVDRATLRGLPQETVTSMIEGIDKLAGETEWTFTPTFKLDGVTYGFIPDLDNISYGENKDICNYISNWETMHNAMAVLYRPIKTNIFNRPKIVRGKYQIEEYSGSAKTADKMKKMPLEVCFGAHVFFYNLTKELLHYIPNYTGIITEKDLQAMQQNGETIKKSTLWQEKI
jgi:hypothetical protein